MQIKFRQRIKANGLMLEDRWHYWGYLTEGHFTAPLGPLDDDARPSYLYTGLKDKNGREIYEGDVVKDRPLNYETRRHEEAARVFEVYWDEKTASFWQQLVSDPDYKFRSGTNFAAEKSCEVIGNRWENPELLEVKEE